MQADQNRDFFSGWQSGILVFAFGNRRARHQLAAGHRSARVRRPGVERPRNHYRGDGELIRHSNRRSVQSRDTAATFLVVCVVKWVGLGHDNVSCDYLEVHVRSRAGLNIHKYRTV
jgi:hypothetical protein